MGVTITVGGGIGVMGFVVEAAADVDVVGTDSSRFIGGRGSGGHLLQQVVAG